MRAARRVDKLRSDARAAARLTHRAFEHIAHAELAADLFHVDGFGIMAQIPVATNWLT